MEEHDRLLHEMEEGDRATITTQFGDAIVVTCTRQSTERADPSTGEIRRTEIWEMEPVATDRDSTVVASITNGLQSSSTDTDFPNHSELYNTETEESLGYIISVDFHEKDFGDSVEEAYRRKGPSC